MSIHSFLCDFEDPRWGELISDTTLENWYHVVSTQLGRTYPVEVSFLFTNDLHMCELNTTHRGIPAPTNVLSFPLYERDFFKHASNRFQNPLLLGDIVLSFEIMQKEAILGKIPLYDHCAHLVVHGLLHLFGYDHEIEEDAHIMETLEGECLKSLGIQNPYTHGLYAG